MIIDARIHTRPTLMPAARVPIADDPDDPVDSADLVEIDRAHEEHRFRNRPTIDA